MLTPPNRGVAEGVTVNGVAHVVAACGVALPPNKGLDVGFSGSLVALWLPKVKRAGDCAGELNSDVV